MAETTTSSCWIHYPEDTPFPIQNLPFGVFHLIGESIDKSRPGVAIGDYVIDLKSLAHHHFFDAIVEQNVFDEGSLNKFLNCGRPVWRQVRKVLQEILTTDVRLQNNEELKKVTLFKLHDIVNLIPTKIGDYTDFYSSKEHASNVGRMLRPDEEPLKPNWLWLPVGYHGRASSVVCSGTSIRRPNGQIKPPTSPTPHFGPCAKLDFELEIGTFIGPGNPLGDPITMQNSEDHIFGMVLMNDWSARDIQAWEYVPLGPFGAKNFGTTVSPWIVTLEALEPFRVEGPKQDPAPFKYLTPTKPGSYDIHLEVLLSTKNLKEPQRISHSNFKYMYWSTSQQLVHHTITGCNMCPGDLIGSGTISGPGDMYGSFIELSSNGKNPYKLSNGDTRSFLEDGDTLILRGWAQGHGYRIGFGDCSGTVLPAPLIH